MGGEVCVVVFIGVLPVGAVIGDCDVGAVLLSVFAGVSTLPREVVELLLLPAFDPECACAKPIAPMNVAVTAVAISDIEVCIHFLRVLGLPGNSGVCTD